MRIFLLTAILFLTFKLSAQENQIAIGLITDNQTKLSKSFAFVELIEKNNIQKDNDKLTAKIVDYVYPYYFGIEGVVFENNVNLKFYKEGKKIKDIKCANDWETIFNAILGEMQKFGNYKTIGKFQNIFEGKQTSFYSRKINENLPGQLTIQVPESKIINLKSINANIVRFKTKNPSEEIKELVGKFTKSDINDILLFKAPQVPENFKSSIKPLLYPISKTMTFGLKMLSYGGVFVDRKENNMALNCFYTTINSSAEILASSKEKAIIKSFSFKNISDSYSNTENRKEMSKLYSLAADINTDFSNSNLAQKEYDEYYASIAKVSTLCIGVEGQVMLARNAMGLGILTAVAGGLSSNASSLSSLGDISALTNSLSNAGAQGAALQQSSIAFFNELSQANNLVKAESFMVEGVDLKTENSYVSNEVLNYLINNPLSVKGSLLDYASDKPKLNKLLLNFYSSEETNKSKLIQDIYIHFNKIEMIITGLETRNKVVEEKYKANF